MSLGQQQLQLPRTDSGGVCVECLVLESLGFVRDSHVDVRSYVGFLVCICVCIYIIYNIHIQSHTHISIYSIFIFIFIYTMIQGEDMGKTSSHGCTS